MCECGITMANADKINALVAGYQKLTKELVNSDRYDVSDDFTVVIQPFMEEMKPPMLVSINLCLMFNSLQSLKLFMFLG